MGSSLPDGGERVGRGEGCANSEFTTVVVFSFLAFFLSWILQLHLESAPPIRVSFTTAGAGEEEGQTGNDLRWWVGEEMQTER